MRCITAISIFVLLVRGLQAQDAATKANYFLNLLSAEQRTNTLYPFDTEERYHFSYIPRTDRKGIAMEELNAAQQQALADLLKTGLTEKTVRQVNDIMQLENVLKELERRAEDDHYRDPGKNYITIFGIPSSTTIWGWRFEGHHASFSLSFNKKDMVAGTPSFMGSNPAIVPDGLQKNKEVLKDETDKGFALLNALSAEEQKKAVIASSAPGEIITGASRKAMIAHPQGIQYNEMSVAGRQLLLQLISLYIHRYTKLFADNMLKDIQKTGLDNIWFSWAGSQTRLPGKPYYYRIQGPSFLIEYDNSQNNANHIHTVIRDMVNDFGGDVLLQHYKEAH